MVKLVSKAIRVIFAIMLIFFVYILGLEGNIKPGISPFDLFGKVALKGGEICYYQDEIEYYYYKEPEESEYVNNKFGLYVYPDNERFFEMAAKLVNSNGGDWGYVLIPFDVKQMDRNVWREVFEVLYDKHLIPIVQLWNVDVENYKKDISKSAEFLDSYIWPVRQRYISVYNEPNAPEFWPGGVDPEEYASILDYSVEAFKSINENYFILNGALNASAPNTDGYMDPFTFMNQMNEAVPGIFERLDGWASHPYPQPNFSGDPYDEGLGSIRAYEAELEYLEDELGVKKKLPVFITETGWAHLEGRTDDSSFLYASEVANNFKTAYVEVWLEDDRVMAVTPFTIRYNPPYDHFNWVDEDYRPLEHYDVVRSMKKLKGNPEKLQKTAKEIIICK